MKRLFALAAAVLLALFVVSPIVLAADPSMSHNGRVLISTNGDVTVPAGEHVDALIVVSGTATINGEVNSIVVVDGALILTGATTESVVAIRSPVTVGAGSVVLGDIMKLDSLVTRIGDAQVNGAVRDIGADLIGIGFVIGPALFLLYVGFALAAIAAGLLLAALAARQVRAAEALISQQPVQTLLAAIAGIFVPIFVVILLVISIVGAPLGIGILLGLWPVTAFVGYLVTGIWIGDWVLARMSPGVVRERPFLAAVVGLLILEVLGIVPFVAGIATLFGYGAVLLIAWRTIRTGSFTPGSMPQQMPAPMPS